MADCDHNCESCGVEGCESRIEKAVLNDRSHIKRIVAVLSGKGGVGKSFVASLLATSLSRKGYKVGIMDADVTGPSIPKSFGVKGPCEGEDGIIYPIESKTGIKIMSANLLLDNEDDPIVWRGPLLGNLVRQFYENVLWEELDYLVIDMPPGTGDVALTIFQMLPVDDLIIVTSPQDLVSLIVKKALKMAEMMNIHVLGVVENMSYVLCPDCGKKIPVFGDSHIDEFAKQMNFKVLGKLPIISSNTKLVDQGKVEAVNLEEINDLTKAIIGK
ncbi:MAG: Mrp/NBP35 family ATP-binding protein [Erysipelotrichaceae bacterium]|jgi:Mrp family chromosome partitioning ATPase|nr:Mrp/NBP35 family ATP-binding protein [Erysipelotrichaceae bacterium]